MSAKPFPHPRLTKSKVGFVTYDNLLQWLEAREAADARHAAREKEVQQEDDNLQKNKNERV
jgi:hypothetical protein